MGEGGAEEDVGFVAQADVDAAEAVGGEEGTRVVDGGLDEVGGVLLAAVVGVDLDVQDLQDGEGVGGEVVGEGG